jgi:hypothetical protein
MNDDNEETKPIHSEGTIIEPRGRITIIRRPIDWARVKFKWHSIEETAPVRFGVIEEAKDE